MITMNDKELKKYEQDLKTFAMRAYPFATKQTINKKAEITQRFAKENIKRNMVTRNKFTAGSVRAVFTRTLNVSRQESRTGSLQDYMESQELGDIKRKKGKEGVPIATSFSSGEGPGTKGSNPPRKKLARRGNKIQNIKLSKMRKKFKTKKQELLVTVNQAVATGKRYIYWESERKRKGIFRVTGGRKKKSGWPGKAKLKMVQDLTHSQVVIPKRPWLLPATKRVESLTAPIYRAALIKQLKRHNLFRK